jgi:hypothetical protein
MLLVVTAVSGWLAWQVCRTEEQASAVAALGKMRGQATSRVRDPEWFWAPFGRLGRTINRAEVDSEQVRAAMPHLKALSDLEEVVVVSWPGPQPHDYGAEAEATLKQEMPHVKIQHHFLMFGFADVIETVHVPDGGTILLEGIKKLKEKRIGISEEE